MARAQTHVQPYIYVDTLQRLHRSDVTKALVTATRHRIHEDNNGTPLKPSPSELIKYEAVVCLGQPICNTPFLQIY